MKLIRPFDLTANGVVESNAPPDEYEPWTPVGRDFLTGYDFIDHCVDNTNGYTYFLTGGGTIRRVDLATGGVTVLGFTVPSAFRMNVNASGEYLAFSFNGGNNVEGVRVRRLSDNAEVFARYNIGSNVFSGFSYDGTVFVYSLEKAVFISVSTDTWTEVARSDTLSEIAEQTVTVGGTGVWLAIHQNDLRSIAVYGESDHLAVTYLAYYDEDGTSAPWEGYLIIARINLSTGAHNSTALNTDTMALGRVVHNPTRGELIFYYGDGSVNIPDVVTDDTFSSVGTLTPSLPLCDEIVVSQDGDELLAHTTSVSPRWRRLAAADYTLRTDLSSALGQSANAGLHSDAYYVMVNTDGGYALVDRTNDSLITQVNPTVSTGDIYTYQNHNYEALQDNNDRPDLGVLNLNSEGKPDPTWLDLGYVNPLRMFDGALDSRTTAPSPLVIEIETGRLTNGLALFNLAASSVQVTYTDPVDGVVHDSGEISLLDNSGVRTWYDFFFEPYSRRSDFARLDLPAYTDGTITITLTNNEGAAEVGEIVVGSIYRIGEAQFGSSAGILDFSRKEQDQFGRFDIVKRRFSKRAEYDAVIDPATGGNIQRTLAQYRAAPVVWIGDESKEETIVYGFFREFDILLDNPAFTAVTITVEGL